MQRFVLYAFGLCSALLLGACSGTLSNPEAFEAGGVQTKDAETILSPSCGASGCHAGICGLPMPVVVALTSTEIETIWQRIIDLAGPDGGTANGG